MRVCVISDYLDSPDYLSERSDVEWAHVRAGDPIPVSDLYVWDYKPGLDVQRTVLVRKDAQHIILASPQYLTLFGPIKGSVCILLKPVSPFTLKTFIELALRTWEAARQAVEAEALRVDRDILLQYVLKVNLRLQEYDHERSNFLARVLHDFRTPLTALLGYCGLLAEGKLGPINEAQREVLDRMCYSTNRLGKLAGGALELLSEGQVTQRTTLREADIQETLTRALNDIHPLANDKGLRLDAEIAMPEGVLCFEPEQVQQVLVNLLENSCKFTPAGGLIQVRGYPFQYARWRPPLEPDCESRSINAYRVDVYDSGCGVSPDLAERIFEAYTSYPDLDDRAGAGLGLAICRAIITAHHGIIWATPAEDGGKFSFILPVTSSKCDSDENYSQGLGIGVELEHAACL
jgi:signal transduction histidine kinase